MPSVLPIGGSLWSRQCDQLSATRDHPNAAKLFIDFFFSKEVRLHLHAISHIPARLDVDPDPPELFKGFQRIFAFKNSPNIADVVRLYNATFKVAK